MVDDAKALALHHALTAPVGAPKWLWRRRDSDLAPVVAGCLAFVVFVGFSAASLLHLLPRVLELICCSIAGAAVAWSFVAYLDDLHAARVRKMARSECPGLQRDASNVQARARFHFVGRDADGKASRSVALVRAWTARCCRRRLGRRSELSRGGRRGTDQRADLALLRRSKRPAAAGPLHL